MRRVEENPRLCGWGAEISSIVAEELFYDLDGPIVRITTPHIPLASADELEDLMIPSADRIYDEVRKAFAKSQRGANVRRPKTATALTKMMTSMARLARS